MGAWHSLSSVYIELLNLSSKNTNSPFGMVVIVLEVDTIKFAPAPHDNQSWKSCGAVANWFCLLRDYNN